MPRDMEFSVPFPVRVNPHLAAARECNLDWARNRGAVTGDEAAGRYLSSHVADLAAYFYPDIGAEDLHLTYDLMGWPHARAEPPKNAGHHPDHPRGGHRRTALPPPRPPDPGPV